MGESVMKTEVPMDVVFKPAWTTWVGAVRGCLNAPGSDCDMIDVAGLRN